MKISYYAFLIAFLFIGKAFADHPVNVSGWQQIDVPSQLTISDRDGNPQTIEPACAFSYLPDEAGFPNSPFHFYFRQGKSDKLLVFLNGGGACWDDNTCLTSLVEGVQPTYNPTIDQNNSPINAGGILNFNRKDNPFSDWSMVFIPYCTGDIHIGSSNTIYKDVKGSLTHSLDTPIMIQHHGHDNFMAVREWIKDNFSNKSKQKTKKLKDLVVAGSSAGGYGAMFNFPYLQEVFPKANSVLLSDGAATVLTQGFIDTVFVDEGNWNAGTTLPTWVPGISEFGNYNAENFNETIFNGLAEFFPKSRFAQYTTDWDDVQVLFYNIMVNLDNGVIHPDTWFQIPPESFCEWNNRMEISLNQTNFAKNYQYYIGAGAVHTVLTDAFGADVFYNESSAEDVKFTKWIKNRVKNKKSDPQNLMCTDCGPLLPPLNAIPQLCQRMGY